MQPNRPPKPSERVLAGLAAALLCGACCARLAIDLGRLGLGGGPQHAASAIGLIAFIVAVPYGLARTLETVHFAAALLVLTAIAFFADALLG